MQAMIESTPQIVDVCVNGQTVPARVWNGVTGSGVPFHAFVAAVACRTDRDFSQFTAELYPLTECKREDVSQWSPDDRVTLAAQSPL